MLVKKSLCLLSIFFLVSSCNSNDSTNCQGNILKGVDSTFKTRFISFWLGGFWDRDRTTSDVSIDHNINNPTGAGGHSMRLSTRSSFPEADSNLPTSGILSFNLDVTAGERLTLTGVSRFSTNQSALVIKVFRRDPINRTGLKEVEAYTFGPVQNVEWNEFIVPIDISSTESEIKVEFSIPNIGDFNTSSFVWLDDIILQRGNQKNCIENIPRSPKTPVTFNNIRLNDNGLLENLDPPVVSGATIDFPDYPFGLYVRTKSNPIPATSVDMDRIHPLYKESCIDFLMRPGDLGSVQSAARANLFTAFDLTWHIGQGEGTPSSNSYINNINAIMSDPVLRRWVLFYHYDFDASYWRFFSETARIDTIKTYIDSNPIYRRPFISTSPQGGSFRVLDDATDGIINYERGKPVFHYHMEISKRLQNNPYPNAFCQILIADNNERILTIDQMRERMFSCALGGARGIVLFKDCAGVSATDGSSCDPSSQIYTGNFYNYNSTTDTLTPGDFSGPNGWYNPGFMCAMKTILPVIADVDWENDLSTDMTTPTSRRGPEIIVKKGTLIRDKNNYKKGQYLMIFNKTKNSINENICLKEGKAKAVYGKNSINFTKKCNDSGKFLEVKVNPYDIQLIHLE